LTAEPAPPASRSALLCALPYILILLSALAAHGLLLVNDVRAADDWMYFKWMENGEWGVFKRFHEAYNNFLQAAPLWPLSYFPNVPNAVHAFSLVVIACIGIVVYRIGCTTAFFSRRESLILSILSICYPAYMWHVSAAYSVFYNLPVLVFYLGLLIAMRSEVASGRQRPFLQSISVLLFLYSFHTGSLLVFFYGAALVHCYAIASARSLTFGQAAWFYFTRRVHFWISPFIFRAAYHFLSHGYITNELRPDFATFAAGFKSFALTLYLQAEAVVSSRSFWWVAAICCLIVAVVKLLPRKWIAISPDEARSTPRQAALTFCLGLALLLAATFAYVATGKTPSPGTTAGYTTRTLLLAQVPLAIIAISVLRLISIYQISRLLVYPVAAGLIAGSVAIQIEDSLKWMYYGVLDRSFHANLSQVPGAKDITYFIVVDRTFYMATIHHPVASLPFEIADIFHGPTHVFGDLAFEFDMSKANTAQASLESLAATYDVRPVINLVDAWELVLPKEYRQGVLVVCPGRAFHSFSQKRLVALYQYYRWLKAEELRRFLLPLLDLRLITLTASGRAIPAELPGSSGCQSEQAKQ